MHSSTKADASTILSEALAASGASNLDPVEQLKQHQKVTSTLLKFQSNQFKYANVDQSSNGEEDRAQKEAAQQEGRLQGEARLRMIRKQDEELLAAPCACLTMRGSSL